LQLLSCGCAHFRVQPNTARQRKVDTSACWFYAPEGLLSQPVSARLTPAALMEFSAPSTHEPERIHSTPACLTGYVPPSGICTLSTVSSSLGRPALFHAGSAHGILALQGFSLTVRSGSSSPHGYPPGVTPSHPFVIKDTRPRISAHRGVRQRELPPPGPCSDSESVLTF
jgi:hypothetical protein